MFTIHINTTFCTNFHCHSTTIQYRIEKSYTDCPCALVKCSATNNKLFRNPLRFYRKPHQTIIAIHRNNVITINESCALSVQKRNRLATTNDAYLYIRYEYVHHIEKSVCSCAQQARQFAKKMLDLRHI